VLTHWLSIRVRDQLGFCGKSRSTFGLTSIDVLPQPGTFSEYLPGAILLSANVPLLSVVTARTNLPRAEYKLTSDLRGLPFSSTTPVMESPPITAPRIFGSRQSEVAQHDETKAIKSTPIRQIIGSVHRILRQPDVGVENDRTLLTGQGVHP